MCIVFLYKSSDPESEVQFVVAANRDEFISRPALSAHFWPDTPIFAGQDMLAKGTWLGFTAAENAMSSEDLPEFKLGVLTNRDSQRLAQRGNLGSKPVVSRGSLIVDFLRRKSSPEDFFHSFVESMQTATYDGFNLLLAEARKLVYFNNHSKEVNLLNDPYHVVSNAFLETPWKKAVHGKEQFKSLIQDFLETDNRTEEEFLHDLIDFLNTKRTYSSDEETIYKAIHPNLTSIFVESCALEEGVYGTRYQCAFIVKKSGAISFLENNFHHEKNAWSRKRFDLFTKPL